MTDRTEPRDPLDAIDLIDLPEPSPPIRETDWTPPPTSPALTALVRLRIEREARWTAANDGDSPKAEQA